MAVKQKVSYIKVGSEEASGLFGQFGWVYTKDGDLYYLWWEEVYPNEMTAIHHVKHSMWISLLREAVAHNLDVEFLTESNYSHKVQRILLYAP
jgi:hypothetical protein